MTTTRLYCCGIA